MKKNKKLILLEKFWNNKKVFITGHSGFKGTWLCVILNMLKSNIYGYSLKPEKKSLFNQTKILKNISSNTYSDINNIRLLKKKITKIKPEIIFHLAAQPIVLESYQNPVETFKTNIMGTVNLLNIIRNIKSVKSVVIITTDKVYKIDKKSDSYKEDDLLGGFDPYSTSKVAVELIVDCYIKSFFKNSKLKNRVSTARAGNVIGGGDYSKDRLVPDIIKSINGEKKLIVRNPSYIRPWQHVIEPLIGYLMLAEAQFKNFKNQKHSYNFGPRKENFKKVSEVINIMKSFHKFNLKVEKTNKNKETKILRLNSFKSQKILGWKPTWNLKVTLKRVFEWNVLFKRGTQAKNICEKQFLMYLNNK